MMNIKYIDIFGQFDSKGTDHYYTYPQTLSPEGRKLFLDPRADLDMFSIDISVSELFLVFCTNDGWWISIVRCNSKNDSRQGYAMFSVCLGANRPTVGAEAVQLLRQGYEQFVDQRVWDNAQTEAWLQTHTLQTTPCLVTPFTVPTSLAQGSNSAYRTFGNELELQHALTFVSQKEYTQYSRVFLLPALVTPVSTGHRMPQITTPVKREFTILHSPDTDSSVPRVALEGETIKIVYLRGNMKSEPISYKVGSPSQAAYRDSAKGCIQLYSAQQAGAKFFKHIHLQSNVRISSLSRELTENGVRFDEATQTLLVPDNLKPNVKGHLQAAGYQKEPIDGKLLSEQPNGKTLKLEFKPIPIDLSLIIDGRSYKVDTLTRSQAEAWEEKGLLRQKGKNSFELNTEECGKQSALSQILQVLGGIFSALVVIYGLYALLCWPFGWKIWPFQHDEKPTMKAAAQSSDDITEGPTTSNAFDEEVSDSDYLKKYDTWDEAELKSERAKQLIAALKMGGIYNIISADEQCFAGVKNINGHWKKIMKSLNEIQNDPEQMTLAETEIRRICEKGKFNLSELQTALQTVANSRNQSAEPANTASAETHHKQAPPAQQPKQPRTNNRTKTQPSQNGQVSKSRTTNTNKSNEPIPIE